MGWGHLEILFSRIMKPEKLNFTWKLSDTYRTKAGWLKSWVPEGRINGNEMHIIFLYGLRLLRWAMWPIGLLFGVVLFLFLFLAGLHKVHLAYRMVNAGRAGL
jgi:hypothetical protein